MEKYVNTIHNSSCFGASWPIFPWRPGSDPEDSIVSIHVEATLVTKTGGWSKVNRPEQDARCFETVENFDLDVHRKRGGLLGVTICPHAHAFHLSGWRALLRVIVGITWTPIVSLLVVFAAHDSLLLV